MAVLVGAHGAVLGGLLKDLLEVGHVLVDVLLEGDDDALLGILQNISIAETGRRNKFGKGLDVGHLKCDLVGPLVALDGLPVDMDVGGLFKALVDRAVVGLRLGAGRVPGQTGDLGLLGQGEGVAFRDSLGRGRGCAVRGLGLSRAAAAGQQGCRHGKHQNESENLTHFVHGYSPLI